jgi:hypothetical protein
VGQHRAKRLTANRELFSLATRHTCTGPTAGRGCRPACKMQETSDGSLPPKFTAGRPAICSTPITPFPSIIVGSQAVIPIFVASGKTYSLTAKFSAFWAALLRPP